MVTLQQLTHAPREIISDFKIFFLGIRTTVGSFWRGYIAFYMEIHDDIKTHLSPFFNSTLYQAILDDFRMVFQSIKTHAVVSWNTYRLILAAILPNRKKIRQTISYITKNAVPTVQKTTATTVTSHGFIYNFFIQYRTLLYTIYTEILEADKTDKIPVYLITSSILIFVFGCVLFYLIMVFGV